VTTAFRLNALLPSSPFPFSSTARQRNTTARLDDMPSITGATSHASLATQPASVRAGLACVEEGQCSCGPCSSTLRAKPSTQPRSPPAGPQEWRRHALCLICAQPLACLGAAQPAHFNRRHSALPANSKCVHVSARMLKLAASGASTAVHGRQLGALLSTACGPLHPMCRPAGPVASPPPRLSSASATGPDSAAGGAQARQAVVAQLRRGSEVSHIHCVLWP
jgi:hypothetical protein